MSRWYSDLDDNDFWIPLRPGTRIISDDIVGALTLLIEGSTAFKVHVVTPPLRAEPIALEVFSGEVRRFKITGRDSNLHVQRLNTGLEEFCIGGVLVEVANFDLCDPGSLDGLVEYLIRVGSTPVREVKVGWFRSVLKWFDL